MTEQQIQKAVFDHLKTRAVPGAFFWHPFSGGFRRPKEAAIYKGLGALAGLPDVMVLRAGQLYALELKPKAAAERTATACSPRSNVPVPHGGCRGPRPRAGVPGVLGLAPGAACVTRPPSSFLPNGRRG